MQMPGRTFPSGNTNYRYGFNGKEKSDEINGSGVDYDYGFRILDTRLGRFLSVDPLSEKFPWYSPYQYSGNKPIWKKDIDGLEEEGADEYQEEMNDLKDEEFHRNLNPNDENKNPYNRPSFITVKLGGMDIRIPQLRIPTQESLDAVRDALGEESPSATPPWLKTGKSVSVNDLPVNNLSTTEGRNNAALDRAKLQNQTAQDIENTTNKDASKNANLKSQGRSGKQAKLNEIINDPKQSNNVRGWLKNEKRHIQSGNRKTMRMPDNSRNSPSGGNVLAHPRNMKARNGHNYSKSRLTTTELHKIEHKIGGY